MSNFTPSYNESLFNLDGKNNTTIYHMTPLINNGVGIVFVILCLFGFVGVSFNFYIFTRPYMNSITYIYMRALTVGDAIIMIQTFMWTLEQWIPEVMMHSKIYMGYQAYAMLYLYVCGIGSSNIMTFFVAIERYLATCKPFTATSFRTKKISLIVCSICFLFAFIFHIPICFNRRMEIVNTEEGEIYIIKNNVEFIMSPLSGTFTISRNIVFRVIPLSVIIILSICVIRSVKQRQNVRKTMQTTTKQQRQELSLNIMIIITVIIFFIVCFLAIVASLTRVFDGPTSQSYYSSFIISMLADKLGYGFSFYIYFACIRSFRRPLLNLYFKARGLEREKSTNTWEISK